MSAQSNPKFLIKRHDTGKVIRIEIEEDKQIFDLLELSRERLNFDEDAILYMYNYKEEVISQGVYVKELGDPRAVWILKDIRMEEKEKRKEKADDNPPKRLEQQAGSDDKSKGLPLDVRNDEIRMLTRKMNSEGLEGFLYEIIPESYTDHSHSTCYEHSFYSEEKRKSIQGKVSTTDNWDSWQAEANLSIWGVHVGASAGRRTSIFQQEGKKKQRKEKTCVAVATKTSFHRMKTFRVNVKLSERAMKDAKHILYSLGLEREQAINEFINKYCSYVYSGPFYAGGWFRIVATATSDKAMEFAALYKEATEQTKTHWSAGLGGCGLTTSGGHNMGSSIQTNGQQSQQNTKSSVQVHIKKESSPGNISSEDGLETKIKDVASRTIFPAIGAEKTQFVPIYEIFENQAEANNDKELAKFSLVLRLYKKGE
ncbi:Hypothetical predicted protein [Paramuricea clavata]|uniref:Uncharacterized protein n=1 Tax=Paramuricea clavata TaxID=317549 RepID=A0A7D9ETM4_PARCT|nr:Hypothetical predicted protein [Paramuricea clavata]